MLIDTSNIWSFCFFNSYDGQIAIWFLQICISPANFPNGREHRSFAALKLARVWQLELLNLTVAWIAGDLPVNLLKQLKYQTRHPSLLFGLKYDLSTTLFFMLNCILHAPELYISLSMDFQPGGGRFWSPLFFSTSVTAMTTKHALCNNWTKENLKKHRSISTHVIGC